MVVRKFKLHFHSYSLSAGILEIMIRQSRSQARHRITEINAI